MESIRRGICMCSRKIKIDVSGQQPRSLQREYAAALGRIRHGSVPLMTGAEQPLWNSYYNLKEALKTQKPKLVVLDMFCPSRFYDDFQPGWADENLDGMRISLNKLEAVYTSVQEEQKVTFSLDLRNIIPDMTS